MHSVRVKVVHPGEGMKFGMESARVIGTLLAIHSAGVLVVIELIIINSIIKLAGPAGEEVKSIAVAVASGGGNIHNVLETIAGFGSDISVPRAVFKIGEVLRTTPKKQPTLPPNEKANRGIPIPLNQIG